MPATIDVPIWYAGLAVVALPAIGWVAATLRLTRQRDEVKAQIADLERLTDWTTPALPRAAGHEPWPQPLSPRLHEKATVVASTAVTTAVVEAAQEVDLEPTVAIVGAHAAPPVEPDWYRNEHRSFTRGWWLEIAARIASVGYKPRLVEHVPAHAAWSLDDDKAVEIEVQRHRGGVERAIAQLLDDVAHMGGVR